MAAARNYTPAVRRLREHQKPKRGPGALRIAWAGASLPGGLSPPVGKPKYADAKHVEQTAPRLEAQKDVKRAFLNANAAARMNATV